METSNYSDEFGVRAMCRVLRVHFNGFYTRTMAAYRCFSKVGFEASIAQGTHYMPFWRD